MIERFPMRRAACIRLFRETGGAWLVLAFEHGWLHGERMRRDRRRAVAQPESRAAGPRNRRSEPAMTRTAAFDAWFAQARAVPLEQIVERRGIRLLGKVDRCGPCPQCGGDDRFSINTAKQLFNCRGCGAKGHGAIDFTSWLDGIEAIPAAEQLNGEPPPEANGKDRAPEPRKVVTNKFIYQDESGTTLFAVGRIEYQNPDGSFVMSAEGKRKKTFSQWRPDPNNAGHVVWQTSKTFASHRIGCRNSSRRSATDTRS